MPTQPKWANVAMTRAVDAAQGRLGRPESTHWKSVHTYRAQYTTAVLLGVGITALCCGAPAVYFSTARNLTIAFGVLGATLIAVGVGFERLTAPRRLVGVVLFEHGFVYLDEERTEVLAFRDIDQVRRRLTRYYDQTGQPSKKRRDKHEITIEAGRTPPLLISDQFTDVAKLGGRIIDEVTQVKLPEVVSRVNQGETVRFGPFGIGLAGIDNGRDVLPWTEVQQLKVEDGKLAIKRDGRWLAWSRHDVGEIPNFSVLLAMAGMLRAAARPGA